MPGLVLAHRSFTMEDQQRFADLSGDHNPIHVDDLAARRALFGRVVVHGVHSALWALDSVCAQSAVVPKRINATFSKPVFLGEAVFVVLDGDIVRIVVDDTTLLEMRVEWDVHPLTSVSTSNGALDFAGSPRVLTLSEMNGLSGTLSTVADDAQWVQEFPSLSSAIGAANVGNIAAVSRLVGMDCPGLNSLFAGFDVTVSDSDEAVKWSVSRTDSRFSVVRMTISGALTGTVNALARPAPVQQPSTSSLLKVVAANEFAGMRALVIGGTRGLGEVTAKLIAAGGGEVAITWHRGENEAKEVVGDLRTCDKSAYSLQLDINDPAEAIRSLNPLVTHAFYFASPRITTRRTSEFDEQQMALFNNTYVDGFVRVLEAFGKNEVTAFYPSTVYVDDPQPDLIEYAAAKAAGENIAKTWAISHSACHVIVERLPKLATDQTATFGEAQAANAVDELLRCVRLVKDAQ